MRTTLKIIGLILLIQLINSCKKDEVPVVTTSDVSEITGYTAICGGTIKDEGSESVTARGVCWSISETPTIADNKTTDGAGGGSFVSSLADLQMETTYYVCAYATNGAGTAYGNVISFTTSIEDLDGNVYTSVKIGDQIWLVENLKTTKYNDGSQIPKVADYITWSNQATPAFCWYNNDSLTYKPSYGALYNWYAVSTGKLCPVGWHVPTDGEWTSLTEYLGGIIVASGKLKESGTTHWNNPNSESTNLSGFTALPGGYRSWTDGAFFSNGDNGSWWSSTTDNSSSAWSRAMTNYGTTDVLIISNNNGYGISVRCLKDN
jgi:uncharacterized protein (TIGR02145 family)